MTNETPILPLDGITVLELSFMPPAELCTQVLADMGATVIKVERPGMPPREARERAASFLNRNKQSLTLDLKQEAGREILHRLAAEADVAVEGFRPGVMARLGGDYETLRSVNRRLVYCSMSGFGQDGPYRDMAAHDLNYLSVAGVLGLIGEQRDDVPHIPLNLVADFGGASMHAVAGIMAALFVRERTGRGQLVDISYVDSTLALLAATSVVHPWFTHGIEPARGKGFTSGRLPAYGMYRTADGTLLSVGALEAHLWRNFCRAVDRPDLEDLALSFHDMLSEPNERQQRARVELQDLFLTRTRDEWLAAFASVDACVTPVYDLQEVMEDPQIRHRQMVVEVDHPEAGRVTHIGLPIKLSDTPASIRSFAPNRGEHTLDILKRLGYGEVEITGFQGTGVV